MAESNSPTTLAVPSSSTSPTAQNSNADNPIKIKSEVHDASSIESCPPRDKGWDFAEEVVKPENKSYEATQSEADSTHTGDSGKDPSKDPICAVCGDKANGMHYRALTCEGCKTFFRRNARRRDSLKCDMDDKGNCEMDLYMRRHCAYCRMKKCLDVGMQVGRLWDKDRLKTRKPIKKTKSTSLSTQESLDADDHETSPGPPPTPPASSKLELSKEHTHLISLIHLAYQNSIIRNQEVPDRPSEHIQEARSHSKQEDFKDEFTQAIMAGMSSFAGGMDLSSQGSIDSLSSSADVTMATPAGSSAMDTKMADIPSCSRQCTDELGAADKLKASAPPPGPECSSDTSMFEAMGKMMAEGGGISAAMGQMMMMGGASTQEGASTSAAGGGEEDEFKEPVYRHVMELSLLILRQMIMFAKALPGFLSLQCEDQAALVKGTFVEYLVLTSGGIFDAQQKQFVSLVMPGDAYDMKDAKMAGFGGMIQQVLDFAEKMAKLELTKEEQSLLYAICVLTADRPELSVEAKTLISSYQEPLVDALCASGRVIHPDQPQFFPKCVMLLTELRNCTESFMDNMMQLKLKGNVVQPLLKEVFEI